MIPGSLPLSSKKETKTKMVMMFDSMIIPDCLPFSSKKETKNMLVDCLPLESDSVIEKRFDNCALKSSAASVEQDTFFSTLGEALTADEERLVCQPKVVEAGRGSLLHSCRLQSSIHSGSSHCGTRLREGSRRFFRWRKTTLV
jgi:hypothetical protein